MTGQLNLEDLARTIALLHETLYTPAPPNPQIWEEHLMIREEMEKVRLIQKIGEKTMKKERTKKELEEFLLWCEKVGIFHENVEVVPCWNHDGYGFRAKKRIAKETEIVRVPREALIDIELVSLSPIMQDALKDDPLVRNNQNVALALFLCSERLNTSSLFSPYIQFLPSTNSVPLFFSVDELKKLKPSPCFEESLIFYRSIVRQFCYFLLEVIKKEEYGKISEEERSKYQAPIFAKTSFSIENFTWDLFSWGVSTVMCRCNSIPSSTAKEGEPPRLMISMIPFLDLANHNSNPEASCSITYDVVKKAAVLTTSKEYGENEEVEMFYGNRTSAEYMIHNGFVPNGQIQNDSFELRLNFSKNDPLAPAKMMKLESVEMARGWQSSHSKKFMIKTYSYRVSSGSSPIPENLKLFVKLFITSSFDDETLKSKELEMKCAEWLKNRLQILQMGYKTTEYVSTREKTIEQLHDYEKEILKQAAEFCSEWFEEIKNDIENVAVLEQKYKKKDKKKKKK